MRRFSNNEKVAGEMAVRRMSEKAQEFYSVTSPLSVYEYEGNETEKLYAYSGCIGEEAGLTFEELEELFEEEQKEIERLNSEE